MSFNNEQNKLIEENARLRAENIKLKKQLDRAVNLLKRYSTPTPANKATTSTTTSNNIKPVHSKPIATQPTTSIQHKPVHHATPPAATATTPASAPTKPSSNSNLDDLDELVNQLSASQNKAKATPAPRNAVSKQIDDDLEYMLGTLSSGQTQQIPSQQQIQQQQQQQHQPQSSGPVLNIMKAPKGATLVHKAKQAEDPTRPTQRIWNKAEVPPSPGFEPVNGVVVEYVFIDKPQLEADLVFLKSFLEAGHIDNTTFQNQRDHMIVQSHGGYEYGAKFTTHPNVKGRSADPEKEERFQKWLKEADTPKWHK